MKSTFIDSAPRFELVDGADMALIGDGKKITLIRIFMQPEAVVPDHSHPNEQVGTCMEGKGILTSGGKELNVFPGVTWVIPGEEIHKFEAKGTEPVVIYEAWSPPREDYRKLAKII